MIIGTCETCINTNTEYFQAYDILSCNHDFLENIRDDEVCKETKYEA